MTQWHTHQLIIQRSWIRFLTWLCWICLVKTIYPDFPQTTQLNMGTGYGHCMRTLFISVFDWWSVCHGRVNWPSLFYCLKPCFNFLQVQFKTRFIINYGARIGLFSSGLWTAMSSLLETNLFWRHVSKAGRPTITHFTDLFHTLAVEKDKLHICCKISHLRLCFFLKLFLNHPSCCLFSWILLILNVPSTH